MEITREELRDALRDMTADMNRGFDGIHGRLDKLNGSSARHDSQLAVHEERWQRLDRATSVKPTQMSAEDTGVKGDWKTLSTIAALGAGAVSGLVWGVFKVVQFITAVTSKP